MSDDRQHLDPEHASLVQQLLATPVGRRWLIKAGLGSAAAVAAAHLPPWDARVSLAAAGPPLPVAAQSATGAARASVPTMLQFALGSHGRAAASSTPTQGASAGAVTNLTLSANGVRIPLAAHTAASRAALKAQGGLWADMNLEAVTHYAADVPLPADRGMICSVQGTRGATQVLVAQHWYAPATATRALAQLAARGGGLHGMIGSEKRLRALGLTPEQVSTPEHVEQLDRVVDPHQTAAAIVGHHPNVATIDASSVKPTKDLLLGTPEVQTLGDAIAAMPGLGQDLATYVPATNSDNKTPTQIQLTDNSVSPPKVITTGFTTLQFNQDQGFVDTFKAGVGAGVKGVRNSGDLGQVIDKPIAEYPIGTPFKTWVQPQGVTPTARPYSPMTTAAGGGLQVSIKNTGLLYGTYTEATGDFSGGQVPLKIYNNWVRWMWVYVQYIAKKDDNLSVNPGATWPDTQYSKSLALLPQVFTVLGVPIWDTNTIDVTLDFPEGAHTARLLYCGLGSNINGGDWRQYFPPDAYADRVAPTDEVLVAALLTGIMTIGLTVFTLAADVAVAGVWVKAREIAEGIIPKIGQPALIDQIREVIEASAAYTAAEAAAATVIGGAATYQAISNNHQSTANIWDILLSMASVIPKVLFSPAFLNKFWGDVGQAVTESFVAEKVLEAIPLMGEVISVLSVVGDVATLAEESAEAIVAPWVIENEVNLTYQATVTVSRDLANNARTWPATARSWRLEALVDGALVLDPITGPLNPDGRTESDPLVMTVAAPFGGVSIKWSFVVLDEAGNQVGTGVSPEYPNDDPADPPSTVVFQITEIPEPITAQTVFQRADTITYSESAGGYTWSEQVTDNGTIASKGIQQVTGVSVSTTAGVVGAVWKQNDRYYLRGIPVAENGATVPLDTHPKLGYARPPFLLFDPFVDRKDIGNHVLLEPDDTSDAYFIRKLTLDPETGAINWDSSTSLGMFPLPVSAAALHSSGRVVAINTETGRLAWLQPVNTPRPSLAAYSAGHGTQVGLLQSPVALAVTNPGTVLVLEAGAARLSSFDLNGGPVQYFGPKNDQYTQSLASPGTYLDVAVDGANQIYLLYHTSDGSQVDDYHIDVYTAAGEPLVTRSPGVNIGRLAVDYWRSVYGVNFDPLTELGTATPRIDPALGVAEPSVSRFDPITPVQR
jgi:hypothetical protein